MRGQLEKNYIFPVSNIQCGMRKVSTQSFPSSAGWGENFLDNTLGGWVGELLRQYVGGWVGGEKTLKTIRQHNFQTSETQLARKSTKEKLMTKKKC